MRHIQLMEYAHFMEPEIQIIHNAFSGTKNGNVRFTIELLFIRKEVGISRFQKYI